MATRKYKDISCLLGLPVKSIDILKVEMPNPAIEIPFLLIMHIYLEANENQ